MTRPRPLLGVVYPASGGERCRSCRLFAHAGDPIRRTRNGAEHAVCQGAPTTGFVVADQATEAR